MPDSAKFCPICGASQTDTAGAQGKLPCPKCGIELTRGTKFCPICGTAVNADSAVSASVMPETPAASAIPKAPAFGTSGEMGAIGRNIEPTSDSLISAMHSAGVPTPSNDIGNSGFASGGSPVASGGSPADGFSAPAAASYAAPASSGSSTPSTDDPFADFGAAAVVTGPFKPIEKKNKVKPWIIIAAAVAVIIAAAAVFFLTNKAAFLSTVMGKSKYAAMVEGTHIQDTLGEADMKALSDGIKSVSEFYPAMSGSSSLGVISGADGGVSVLPTSYPAANGATDLKGLIDAYNRILSDTYGANAVTVTVNGDITLSDSVKSTLGSSSSDISEIIDKINNGTLTYEVAASDNALGYTVAAESGNIDLDMKVIVNSDGAAYLVFPFAGEKGIKLKIDADAAAEVQTEPLELDPDEMKRLLEEIVRIYVEEYSNSAIEMENGMISAGGLTAKGKLITAEFKGDKLAELFKKIGQHIADDRYLTDKIVSYANSIGAELSEAEYKKEITDTFGNINIDSNDSLIISTVVDRQGGVLARKYECVDGADTAYAAYVDNKNELAFEAAEYDTSSVAVFVSKDSDKDGSVSVKVTSGSENVNVKLDYSGVEKVKYGNKDIFVGTFTLSAVLPADFSDSLGAEGLAAVNGASITFGNSVDGSTLNSGFSIDVPKYASLTVNSAVTPKNGNDWLNDIPADVIDASGAADGSLDAQTEKELEDYFNSVLEKVKAQDEELSKSLENLFGVAVLSDSGAGSAIHDLPDQSDIDDLKDFINYDIEYIEEYDSEYLETIGCADLIDSRDEIIAKLKALLNDIGAKSPMTWSEYYDFVDREYDIEEEMDAFDEKVSSAAYGYDDELGGGFVSTGSHVNDDFDSMDIFELAVLKGEYDVRFENFSRSDSDKAQQKLFDAVQSAYNRATKDFENYYYNSNDLANLRNIRYTLKDYIKAVEELENYQG